ncbi:hypothetical protein [Pararhizobium haloflavum]|uniref:hypothetical protein n=1 Tax=Pararhizobium haloflavum TaxID=2037914 RepID=UPI0012FFE8FB|nr:hypothetical protein [Pararhizobium haloflavum]
MSKRRSVEVFDTPSGLGGSYTVEIIDQLDAYRIRVCVWYGRATHNGWERWPDWDGYTFETTRDKLTNKRQLSLFK